MNRDVAPSDRASLLGAFPRWAAGGLFLLLGACALEASAQGPIPFELNDPGEAFQAVEMDLAIHDTELLGSEIDVRTDDTVRAVRDQEGAGAESGSLRLLPGALALCFFDPGNPLVSFCNTPLDSEGTRPFYEIRNPPGSSSLGGIPGLSTIGELVYKSFCGNGCAWLEGPLESKATAGFDLPGGTLDASARVESPDYGVNLDFGGSFGSRSHMIFARGIASLNDWVYVSGPAPTATLTITASIDATVEDPDPTGNTNEYWITQGYGDLREVDAHSPTSGSRLPATVHQMTSLRVFLSITGWSFEEVCEPIDDEGNEICSDDWVSEVITDATALRERESLLEYEYLPTEVLADIPNFDTGPLPPTLVAQATVPTGEWIEVFASAQADTECRGAMDCDLDVYTNEPVQLSITSSSGTLSSWSGIAGLTRVPEPAGALAGVAALGALGVLTGRCARCPVDSPREQA